jgi:UDP-N-acetylglucosamine diphosphorylase/glucosamine-1-phosphate N-acetyltransferase
MKNIILFDPDTRSQLLPLTYTRPVCEIRLGIWTIREKWEHWLNGKASYITQDYLSDKFPITIEKDNWVINGSVLPNEALCKLINNLKFNQALLKDGELLAARIDEKQFYNLIEDNTIEQLDGFDLDKDVEYITIERLWDIFSNNDKALHSDFERITKGRTSAPLSKSNQVVGDISQIFLEEGATVECAILNTKKGPIYIDKNAEIMEGCSVRGGLALCEGSVLKMGAKIYGATTIGPYSKVGGEVNNVVIFGHSNKGHEGYLGNSVIGEWCNLGADTNTSNLKNNYEPVKLWDYTKDSFQKTGLQFLGLIMADHAKCAINTMFNTGTVVGVSANVFGAGFPRNFIPSFSWGGVGGFETYTINKALETAERVFARRNITLDETERAILQYVYDYSVKYRTWEKTDTKVKVAAV